MSWTSAAWRPLMVLCRKGLTPCRWKNFILSESFSQERLFLPKVFKLCLTLLLQRRQYVTSQMKSQPSEIQPWGQKAEYYHLVTPGVSSDIKGDVHAPHFHLVSWFWSQPHSHMCLSEHRCLPQQSHHCCANSMPIIEARLSLCPRLLIQTCRLLSTSLYLVLASVNWSS